MAYHYGGIAPELVAALFNLRGKVPQAILSERCGEARLKELATIFGDLPVLKGYRCEDASLVFRCLCAAPTTRWSVNKGNIRVPVPRPGGRLTPLRKPSAELVEGRRSPSSASRGTGARLHGGRPVLDGRRRRQPRRDRID